jgi:hypothetical protein
MNEFKKNIFKKSTSVESAPTTPTISLTGEENIDCYGQILLRINTNIPIKVNITGNFVTGGSYLDSSILSLGGTKVFNNLSNDLVTFRQSYNFGIAGSKLGTLTGTSSISLEIRDDVTNALIDNYVFTRSHTSTQC